MSSAADLKKLRTPQPQAPDLAAVTPIGTELCPRVPSTMAAMPPVPRGFSCLPVKGTHGTEPGAPAVHHTKGQPTALEKALLQNPPRLRHQDFSPPTPGPQNSFFPGSAQQHWGLFGVSAGTGCQQPLREALLSQTCPQPFKCLHQRRMVPRDVFSFLPKAGVGREVLLLCLFFPLFSSHSVISTEQPFHLRGARAAPVNRGV